MSSKSLLTYGSRFFSVEQAYFSPVASIPSQYGTLSSIYCFLANQSPWDDNNITTPTGDLKYIRNIQKNIFVAKRININDISPVVKRIDWVENTIYDYYQDDVDMFETDDNKLPILLYYVRNSYDQIYKCLWNNNGAASTDEPVFEPGKLGTDDIFTGVDGYKWKYLYTISSANKIKFLDSDWMPVPAVTQTINPLKTSAGFGNIEVINVLDGGDGYDAANSAITLTITGDGSGAAATAVTSNGQITNIIVDNAGTNYTYASVSVSSEIGANAVLIAPVSPSGGHGFEPMSELGCQHVMFSTQFTTDESGYVFTDISYQQLGLLVNPVLQSTGNTAANGTIYRTTTDLIVSSGFGDYLQDEYIYQGDNLESSSFSARVLEFDISNNIIYTINTKGTMSINTPVLGNTSLTTRTLLNYSIPDFVTLSGKVAYVDSRTSIVRDPDGIEQFKVVLGY